MELEDNDWHLSFNYNVMSIVHFVRFALPLMKKSNFARIINISSISGVQPGLYNPHYTITKAAVINLTKYLANTLASEKITVNVVCPGTVYTDSWDSLIKDRSGKEHISYEEAKLSLIDQELEKIPLNRIGTGDDIAGLVTFLASEKASWITGSCYHIDGGKLKVIQ